MASASAPTPKQNDAILSMTVQQLLSGNLSAFLDTLSEDDSSEFGDELPPDLDITLAATPSLTTPFAAAEGIGAVSASAAILRVDPTAAAPPHEVLSSAGMLEIMLSPLVARDGLRPKLVFIMREARDLKLKDFITYCQSLADATHPKCVGIHHQNHLKLLEQVRDFFMILVQDPQSQLHQISRPGFLEKNFTSPHLVPVARSQDAEVSRSFARGIQLIDAKVTALAAELEVLSPTSRIAGATQVLSRRDAAYLDHTEMRADKARANESNLQATL